MKPGKFIMHILLKSKQLLISIMVQLHNQTNQPNLRTFHRNCISKDISLTHFELPKNIIKILQSKVSLRHSKHEQQFGESI